MNNYIQREMHDDRDRRLRDDALENDQCGRNEEQHSQQKHVFDRHTGNSQHHAHDQRERERHPGGSGRVNLAIKSPADEQPDENEAPIRESSDKTEAPEEFELDDEDEND